MFYSAWWLLVVAGGWRSPNIVDMNVHDTLKSIAALKIGVIDSLLIFACN